METEKIHPIEEKKEVTEKKEFSDIPILGNNAPSDDDEPPTPITLTPDDGDDDFKKAIVGMVNQECFISEMAIAGVAALFKKVMGPLLPAQGMTAEQALLANPSALILATKVYEEVKRELRSAAADDDDYDDDDDPST